MSVGGAMLDILRSSEDVQTRKALDQEQEEAAETAEAEEWAGAGAEAREGAGAEARAEAEAALRDIRESKEGLALAKGKSRKIAAD